MRRVLRCRARSRRCSKPTSSPTAPSPSRRRWCRMSALTALPKGALRRAGPPALIAAALLFGVLSVGYAWIVARHLRNDARETSRLLGHVFAGLNDPREGAAADALLALADEVRRLGIPLAVTDTAGRITALDNQPFDATASDRLWVAMARESAHQLGTPLMSITGWIDYLRENPGTPASELVGHLEADAERLQRVAKRFERIGRPARREPVGLGTVAERVVAYFRPRLPTLAHAVTITLTSPGAGPTATGDPVLIEWALEVLVKNAVDALSGRGGRIEVEVEGVDALARVSVRDDGPGVAPDMQHQLFEPGVSSKTGGWGIGLALARRSVEQQHD